MANLRVDKITSTETFDKTGSVQFDASSGSGLVVGSSDCDFGTGDFTIEGWFLVQDSAAIRTIFDSRTSDNNSTGLFLGINTDDTLYTYGFPSGTTAVSYGTPEPNTWHHVAVVRNGSDGLVFLDGKLVSSGVKMGSSDYTQEGGTIGQPATSFAAGLYRFKGHISNLRIIKGTALYTSNFKPPMKELEVTAETVVLACQSKTDASLEKTGKTITANGTAVASELTPGLLTPIVKSGGGSAITGSVEFDGSGATAGGYLEVTPDDDLQFLHKCTDSYTVEAWVHKQASTQGTIFDNGGTSSTTIGIVLFDDSGVLKFRARQALSGGGFHSITTGDVMANNMWHHVALTYDKSTVRLFVNGILVGSTSYSTESSVDSTQSFKIGTYEYSGTTKDGYLQGFISNFRIVKGTALYTADFIPPTRELKKVPGTVLLCCQDPNNPLTEATGKTITPYGSLGDGGLGGELVTNNSVWTMTCGGTSCTNWTASNNGRSLAGTTVASGYIRATYTIPKGDYLVSFRWTGGAFAVQSSAGYVVATDGTDTEFSSSEDGAYSVYMSDTTYVRFTGTSWSTAYTVDDISFKRIYRNNGASRFTPQVGDDRQVTFEGVTKINTDAYFYLPTGDTASRETTGTYNAGTRAVYHSTESPVLNTIEYLTIATLGSVENFGDLTNEKVNQIACSSDTRGLFATGYTPSPASGNNFIDYVTIMSTGNALDFGELSYITYVPDALSNQIRGIWGGGAAAPVYIGQDDISYVTIASRGNGIDFGNLTDARHSLTGLASPTRGIFGAGQTNVNTMDYITIASTGNAQDFGDLILGRAGCAGASSSIRGLFAGGYTASPSVRNIIEFITIATMGNSQDFGDLTAVRRFGGGTSSSTRGVFIAGFNPSATNTIDYVSIQTTGNAVDFGDFTINKTQSSACSNGHGGLG